jgi:hypothetical protein
MLRARAASRMAAIDERRVAALHTGKAWDC